MKTKTLVSLGLSFVLLSFCACNQVPDASEAGNVLSAGDTITVPTVTITEGDKQITIEDATNLTVTQLLDKANISLSADDIVSIDPSQALSGNLTINVLRMNSVKIVLNAGTSDEMELSTSVIGGTVKDALDSLGIKLKENQVVNYPLDKVLTDDMNIVISTNEPEPTEAPTEQTNEEPEKPDTTPKPTKKPSNNNKPTNTPKPTKKPTPKPTKKPTKKVVSKQFYEDCDGSGHGVWVITYDDGSQEEKVV